MDDITAITALATAMGAPKIIELIYPDLLRPGVQQIGKAVGSVLGLANTALLPIQLLNERCKMAFEANIENYRIKLASNTIEEIAPVSAEIAVPLIDSFTYLQDPTLCSMYVELLRKASLVEMRHLAHPGFISVLKGISPDEGLLLNLMVEEPLLASITWSYRSNIDSTVIDSGQIMIWIRADKKVEMAYDQNTTAYISNLIGHGLVVCTEAQLTGSNKDYDIMCEKVLIQTKGVRPNTHPNLTFARGVVQLTALGRLFLSAVFDASQP